eukprot:4375092-Amphidinium_carterae.1
MVLQSTRPQTMKFVLKTSNAVLRAKHVRTSKRGSKCCAIFSSSFGTADVYHSMFVALLLGLVARLVMLSNDIGKLVWRGSCSFKVIPIFSPSDYVQP